MIPTYTLPHLYLLAVVPACARMAIGEPTYTWVLLYWRMPMGTPVPCLACTGQLTYTPPPWATPARTGHRHGTGSAPRGMVTPLSGLTHHNGHYDVTG